MTEIEFWVGVRQALLLLLDVLERWRGISPRTAEIRQEWRKGRCASEAGEDD